MITAGDKLQRWDLKARNPTSSPLELAADNFNCVSLGPNGRWLAAQIEDGVIRIWDLDRSPVASRTLAAETSRYEWIVTDGKWMAATTVANDVRGVHLWDLEMKQNASVLLPPEEDWWNIYLAISPDSRWLAVAGANRASGSTVRLFDLDAPDPLDSLLTLPRIDHGPVGNFMFTQDSRWLFATEGYTGRIHRWDLGTADLTFSETVLRGHRVHVQSLSATSDSGVLLSGSLDGTVRLWNPQADHPSVGSEVVQAHDAVQAVAIHPRGHWFATVSMEGAARLWDRRGVHSDMLALRASWP